MCTTQCAVAGLLPQRLALASTLSKAGDPSPVCQASVSRRADVPGVSVAHISIIVCMAAVTIWEVHIREVIPGNLDVVKDKFALI